MRIDLHIHSTASDGNLPPAAVVDAARAGGLDVIALTDHDTTAGVEEAQRAAGDDITVLPGVELSTTFGEIELHILGYLVDPESPPMRKHRRLAGTRRRERMQRMIDRLADLGLQVRFEEVAAAAGPDSDTLGRPHLARVLHDKGLVSSYAEAFDRYLADEGPAYVPVDLVNPEEAIDHIHAAGGIAVWAHPPLEIFEEEIERFAEWGLDGVECLRPNNTTADERRLINATRALGLLVTGGSDWHGDWSGPLGRYHIDRDEIGRFLARADL